MLKSLMLRFKWRFMMVVCCTDRQIVAMLLTFISKGGGELEKFERFHRLHPGLEEITAMVWIVAPILPVSYLSSLLDIYFLIPPDQNHLKKAHHQPPSTLFSFFFFLESDLHDCNKKGTS